jgi:Protein of unknown function (DUF2975)
MTTTTGTAAYPAAKSRNPLEPIATIIGYLVPIVGVLAVLSIILTLIGHGYGDGPTVTIPTDKSLPESHLWHARPGVHAQTSQYSIDIVSANFGQRFLFTLAGIPAFILVIGALMLARRMLDRAQWEGIYTVATARRLRTLAWFLIGGSLVRMVIEGVANILLLNSMVTNWIWWADLQFFQLPLALLFLGAMLLSIARIVRIGAQMNDELQATV